MPVAILLLAWTGARAPGQAPLRITESTVLERGTVLRQGIVIAADGITLDGDGAVLSGPADPADPKSGKGIGILAEGRSRITLRNFRVRGFESGLVVRGGSDWTITGCDFSGNYHDPEFGWGDGERVGGMILTDLSKASITSCTARNNWNGLDLWGCEEIRVDGCVFSHCSNVCLKMWRSSRNHVFNSDLSYGLRIRKGEVHARDSTCVLLESGSNDNVFEGNDITHGGDGVFIRVLNGWVSTGNVFKGNDCSYANNNGFESWSPGNTYIGNKSNHCSYGFWLGGSDRTVLIGNEASHNGLPTGFHNAPEPDFGHGGIVIVNGSGSHTLIDSNTCIGNQGGGIVFRGDLSTRGGKWRMRHLVVQRNRLEGNQVGIFARFTRGLVLSGNRFRDNGEATRFEDVAGIRRLEGAAQGAAEGAAEGAKAPLVAIAGVPPRRPVRVVRVGEPVRFAAEGDPGLDWHWQLADRTATGPVFEHRFTASGFFGLGLTGDDGKLAGLASCDVYAIDAGEHPATEAGPAIAGWRVRQGGQEIDHRRWLAADSTALVGEASLRLRPDRFSGAEVELCYPVPGDEPADLSAAGQLSFWLRFRNPNHTGFQGPNPIVRLHSGTAAFAYVPVHDGLPRNLLGDLPHPEAREGWLHVRIPLEGGEGWHRSVTYQGPTPPFVSGRLEFTTLDSDLETREATSLAAGGEALYCAAGAQVFRSADGRRWTRLPRPEAALGKAPQWINGMLTFAPALGTRGSLLLTAPARRSGLVAHGGRQLIVFDIGEETWRWHETITAMGHGATLSGDHLFGLAHAVGGNYGGPLCRVDIAAGKPLDDHSVLGGVRGADAWWFSRAAQLATLGGRIYAVKNDWKTPAPDAAATGDRLLRFDPARYVPSAFRGGERWSDANWQAADTPAEDLGALPFEIGHGAALVALPPGWHSVVGEQGGLFLLAGCSPSDHEGHGRPSEHWALYDVAGGRFTTGTLPGPTGSGTSACLFGDRIVIKRGGLRDGTGGDRQLWTVRGITAAEAATEAAAAHAAATQGRAARARPDLSRIDRLTIQLDPSGGKPFTVWIDGLQAPGLAPR